MKINAVKFKNKKSFDKNKSKLNVKEVHEPFGIIVFEDPTEVAPDTTKVSQVNSVSPTLEEIPTGLAIVVASDFKSAERYFKTKQIRILESFEPTKTFIVDVPDFQPFEEFYSQLTLEGIFISIEPDNIIKAEKSADDFYNYTSHWHLGNVKAQEGWNQMPTNVFGDVAVLDVGCETTHEDLVGAFNLNWDCVTDNGNVEPKNEFEKHGTPCSGIISARNNNGIGAKGVGNNQLRVQFLNIGYNAQSSGAFSTSDTICTRAINKALANPSCLAISMSWGGGMRQTAFENALNIARTQGRGGKGIPIFASSGNNNYTEFTQYPAYYNAVMGIGASNTNNQKASFSNAGTKLFAVACGTALRTIDRTGIFGYTNSQTGNPTIDNYCNFSGTSASTPLFAGIVAMMLLKNPNLTENDVRIILKNTCRKLGGYNYVNGRCNEMGFGIIDMDSAIREAGAYSGTPTPPVDPLPPTTNLTGILNTPKNAVSGSSVVVGYSVLCSNPNFPQTNVNCEVYISRTQSIQTDSKLIDSSSCVVGGGTGNASLSFNYTIPANISGDWFFVLKVDTTNAVNEMSEIDNLATSTIAISSPVVGNIDMKAEILSYAWQPDGRCKIAYRFTNVGTTTVTSCKIIVGFQGAPQITWNRPDVLQPNAKIDFTTNWVLFPTTFPAIFSMTITQVNGTNDSNPSNNTASILVNR